MNVEAFILIGGRSSRLGTNKALVTLGGVTLVERAAATLVKSFSPRALRLVAANDSQFSSELGLRKALPFIFDHYEGRGPVGALHAALAYAQTEWVFIMACDLPFVSTELIERLFERISQGFDAIAPIQPDGRVQPLCAFYRVEPCLAYLEGIFAKNNTAPPLKAIFENVRTHFVQFHEISDLTDAERFFTNINTSEDLQAAASSFVHCARIVNPKSI